MKRVDKELIIDYIAITVGSIIVAFAINYFYVPNKLAQSGLTGISLMVHYWSSYPVSTIYLVLNIPILIIGFIFLGKEFLLKTLYGTLVLTLSISYLSFLSTNVIEDRLMAAMYAGIVTGIGLGIIFARGGSTGGTDVIAKILYKYLDIEMGKALLMLDAIILTCVMFFFGKTTFLYTLIAVFLNSKIIDVIINGFSSKKFMMIISPKHVEIKKFIMREKRRGVTILHGEGGYTGKDVKVICCVITKFQLRSVKQAVTNIDPEAFIVVNDVHEVLGKGFTLKA